MTTAEAKRKLKKQWGIKLHSHGTNHDWYINPENGKKTQIGRHDSKEMPTGTWKAILDQLGLK